MAIVQDLVVSARRILGDTQAQQWTDARMLDIVNSGLRDINKFTGSYREEYIFELQKYRYRYPLPTDLYLVTSVWYKGLQAPSIDRNDDKVQEVAFTKDQLNLGIIEMVNLPLSPCGVKRVRRFHQSPIIMGKGPDDVPLWANDEWNVNGQWKDNDPWGVDPATIHDEPFEDVDDPTDVIYLDAEMGVVTDPVVDALGVSDDLAFAGYDFMSGPSTNYGTLGTIVARDKLNIKLKTSGDKFGVMTSFSTVHGLDVHAGGVINDIKEVPVRIAGRYGIVTSVLKSCEYVKVRYKALPPRVTSLSDAFSLSAIMEDIMINWIVAKALLDDNDAANMGRSQSFATLYTRDLEDEAGRTMKSSTIGKKSNRVKYRGGITND